MKFFAFATSICLLLCSFSASAQDQKAENDFYTKLEEQVDQLRGSLKLEDWQVFYADSILSYNMTERNKELKKLQEAKVGNQSLYYVVADKWDEATYQAFKKILDDVQWEKYNKKWAGKAKKERDKRAAKKL